MSEFFDKFSGGELIGLTSVVLGIGFAIVSVIVTNWRRARIVECESELKQNMLDRGFSPTDIEQILNSGNSSSCRPLVSTGNETLDKAALAKSMVDQGYEAGDIERVLRAFDKKGAKPENHDAVR